MRNLTLPFLVAMSAILAAVPAVGATHIDVPSVSYDAPCPSEGAVDTTTKGFSFDLEGFSASLGDYRLQVKSDHEWIAPEGYLFFGDEFSHFRGTLTTASGVYDVDLVWRKTVGVYQQLTQVAPVLELEGEATDGAVVVPVKVEVVFAQVPIACTATADVFNHYDVCMPLPGGEAACIPLGFEVITTNQVYYNGPATLSGSIDGLPAAGAGLGHGSAHVWLYGRFPS